MKQELKSGITELDNLIEDFENGKINFVELTSNIWNSGYSAGRDYESDLYYQTKDYLSTQ